MVHDNIIDYVTTHVFLFIAQCYACFQEYPSSIQVPGKFTVKLQQLFIQSSFWGHLFCS